MRLRVVTERWSKVTVSAYEMDGAVHIADESKTLDVTVQWPAIGRPLIYLNVHPGTASRLSKCHAGSIAACIARRGLEVVGRRLGMSMWATHRWADNMLLSANNRAKPGPCAGRLPVIYDRSLRSETGLEIDLKDPLSR